MLRYKVVIALRKQINKLVKIPFPDVHQGNGSVSTIGELLVSNRIIKPLIVTDKALNLLGMVDKVTCSLVKKGIDFEVFDEVNPDPSVESVLRGLSRYKSNGCDGIIALGGGSSLDCAKVIGAKVVRDIDIEAMAGQLKVRKKLPHIIAIPTTAGTGSEATIAAVISDHNANRKFAILDPVLVPQTAILDPELMVGLPPAITAATGMDALTHAIEAYIGEFSNPLTDEFSEDAITKIFKALPEAYENGGNLVAREAMAIASYKAGCAFTRAFVGYVHAIAHQLGAIYHIPHGLANAILLPHVLRFNLADCESRFKQMAQMISVTDGEAFISAVENLNRQLNIPSFFEELKPEDIPEIAKRALIEAHGTYPVPCYMSQQQCETLIRHVLPTEYI
ncbi:MULTISPECIES: iron-containing alcohol dehydrogenase [Vibrio]|uniref:iron-containing alcohol dehydrogenase n=1 Tax=Vibrio TaxID=662 RepID=UPI003D14C15A